MATTASKTKDELKQALSGAGRVAVLYGGVSSERAVSLQSGLAISEGLQNLGLDVTAIDIGHDAIAQLEQAAPEYAFIALHGGAGEDGCMQALLEYLQIPYTGSGVGSCAHAMDKLRCKYLWRGMDLPTPEFAVLSGRSDFAELLVQLGGAVMVKPASEGSSIGMAPARSAEEFKQAYLNAAKYDSCVIAERLIRGKEYTVAVLGDQVLPSIELQTDHSFYDYDAKYIADDTRYICPSDLPEDREAQLRALAKNAFDSLGCQGWGRVDVMADDDGNFYLLEVNTVPGMTSHSLVPMAAKAAGLDFDQLVGEILLHSMQRARG